MAERAEVLDLGVIWEPNAPEAVLLSDDYGRTVLAMNPHPDDSDTRCVVVVWKGTSSACLGGPNDEAISGHRLYRKGLKGILWAVQVRNSNTIRDLERQNRVHPRHDPARFHQLVHHVILTKEAVVEVVAETLTIQRIPGTTLAAAMAAVRG